MAPTTLQLLALALFAGGIVLTPLLGRIIAARTAAQRIEHDVEAEMAVLTELLAHPELLEEAAPLAPGDFAYAPHGELLTELRDAAGWTPTGDRQDEADRGAGPAEGDDPEAAALLDYDRAAVLALREGLEERELLAELVVVLEERTAAEQEALAELEAERPEDRDADPEVVQRERSRQRLLQAGQSVINLSLERTELNASPIAATEPPDLAKPLHRPRSPLSRREQALVAIGTAGGLGVSPYLAATALADPVAQALGAASLALAVLVLVVVSLVDLRTLYVDLVLLWTGTAAAAGLGVAAALAEGDRARVLSAAYLTVGMVGGLWLVAGAYRLIRKRPGLGGGDINLVPLVCGVPTLVSGSIAVGLYAFPMAAAVSLAFVLPSRIRRFMRGDRGPAYLAFGPYLAIGWIPAWLLVDALLGLGG